MAKVIGKDIKGNTLSTDGFDLSQGLTIEAIDKNLVWTLTTKDDTPATYTVPHLGGRPDDRS